MAEKKRQVDDGGRRTADGKQPVAAPRAGSAVLRRFVVLDDGCTAISLGEQMYPVVFDDQGRRVVDLPVEGWVDELAASHTLELLKE